MLTPAELVHLVSAHTRIYPDPRDPWDNSPVAVESRERFLKMGVIYQETDGHYRTTEMGGRWIERILATPDPAEWERILSVTTPPGQKLT